MKDYEVEWTYLTCPECKTVLRYERFLTYPPPPTAPMECPVCGAKIYETGRNIEIALIGQYEKLPFTYYWTGFKEMLRKDWPYLVLGGVGITGLIIWLLSKK